MVSLSFEVNSLEAFVQTRRQLDPEACCVRCNKKRTLAYRVQRSYEAMGGLGRRARTVDILVGCSEVAPALWGSEYLFSCPRCLMNARVCEPWQNQKEHMLYVIRNDTNVPSIRIGLQLEMNEACVCFEISKSGEKIYPVV